jgi:AAA domain-containing protein
VIVVVEGPSGAGKTTWTRRHCDPAVIVAETSAVEAAAAPAQRDQPQAAAEFWARLNSARWRQALRIEEAHGIAVCDSDPFKLHYPWTLWRTGHASRSDWTTELEASRRAFEAGRLGIADLMLVTIPDRDTLVRRRAKDKSRLRRNFDLHVQLTAAIDEWYRAIEQLDPGRVIWHLPAEGLPGKLPPREPRSGIQLFDALLARLPAT